MKELVAVLGLEIEQVRQLIMTAGTGFQLKKLVAERSLDKTMLQDVPAKQF